MKQFQFEYSNPKALNTELLRIKRYCGRLVSCKTVFEIYTSEVNTKNLNIVTSAISEILPGSQYYGCLSCANIYEGELSSSRIMIVGTIFEYDTTNFEILQLSSSDPDFESNLDDFISFCNKNTWIKSVEMHLTVKCLETDIVARLDSGIREDLHFVGGCSCNPDDVLSTDTFVFTMDHGLSHDGVIFFMIGGEDFHAFSTYVLGYKPLGKRFTITDCDGPMLRTLDDQPAFDAYKKYLKIEKNEHFFSNVLGFPMIMRKDGVEYLRTPVSALDDDTLFMSGDVYKGCQIRLAYGDQNTILKMINSTAHDIADFSPDGVRIYSCFTRKMYWGDENVSEETAIFSHIAPTTGFYTRGEILRIKGISLLNSTLVLVALREGDAAAELYKPELPEQDASGKVSFINRLINFISVATDELEEANRQLRKNVITDGLTQLYNRKEIQSRITNAIEAAHSKNKGEVSVIMIDIDFFKRVNDSYGHKEGDNVIVTLSGMLGRLDSSDEHISAGRWGGEEFMLLLDGYGSEDAAALAEKLRIDFEETDFPISGRHTISVGVTQMTASDTCDSMCIRVDKALYQAKSEGKNRTVLF